MTCRRALVLLAALLAAGTATAQTDLTGTWDITAQMSLAVDEVPAEPEALCEYNGDGEMTQVGDDVTGPINLTQTSSVMDCPPKLSGDFAGTLMGSDLTGTITSGMETSTVVGAVTGGSAPATAPAGTLMIQNGGLNVTAGPYLGTTGTFAATIAAPTPIGGSGMLVILALILLVGGSLLLSRRSRQA